MANRNNRQSGRPENTAAGTSLASVFPLGPRGPLYDLCVCVELEGYLPAPCFGGPGDTPHRACANQQAESSGCA